MVSNALSKRRGLLRRPKVCLTPINPGRCEPPPPVAFDCTLVPGEQWIDIRDQGGATLHFCRGLPQQQNGVALTYDEEDGSFSGPPTGFDCQDVVASYFPSNPGTWWISFTAEWFDGETCTRFGIVHVSGP